MYGHDAGKPVLLRNCRPSARRGLVSESTPVSSLSDRTRDEMLALFRQYFVDPDPARFHCDLEAKDVAILLRDSATSELRGFSTLAVDSTCVDGNPAGVLYSGDTVVAAAARGTTELPRAWIRTVHEVAADLPRPLYWLLISSGFRTYRFLPLFFREFYPRHDAPAPPSVQRLMDRLAESRFGAAYNARAGVVQFARGATPLRPELARVPPGRLKDPNVAFFLARNPGHAHGDELVCLTRVEPSNFTPAARRMLG
ncbi:MAG TPA: hypothetical protein VNZ57_06310 [Longimicrobiales bacterium]|nr:hypothetical protein [Longimicrobiales bacterium]